MFINWNDEKKENPLGEELDVEEPCELTKVYVEKQKTGSIIGKYGNNIQKVQKIAKTCLITYSATMSVINIEPYRNQSLQDALVILQGIYNLVVDKYL